jgi:hypothetical protein
MNTGLARAVLDHLDAHPEAHNQYRWGFRGECGTTACIAGWALILSGYEPGRYENLAWDGSIPFIAPDGTRLIFDQIGWQARQLLDLSDAEFEYSREDDEFGDLFAPMPEAEAIARLREITEKAEAELSTQFTGGSK